MVDDWIEAARTMIVGHSQPPSCGLVLGEPNLFAIPEFTEESKPSAYFVNLEVKLQNFQGSTTCHLMLMMIIIQISNATICEE